MRALNVCVFACVCTHIWIIYTRGPIQSPVSQNSPRTCTYKERHTCETNSQVQTQNYQPTCACKRNAIAKSAPNYWRRRSSVIVS
jgi:hypothetical protein